MNRENHIREMSDLIYENRPIKDIWNEEAESIAETLYNAGYRKQKEGEWIKSKSGLFVCSVCDTTCPYDAQADDISYWECKFCPNCGAKMKGGKE